MHNNIQISSNRGFGIVFFIFFFILSIWPIKNGNEINYLFLIISSIFLLLGILNSKYLTPLNRIWFKFGLLLGSLISPIIMGIIFFLIVTPISFIMRFFGKDILNIKKNKKKSYWIDKNGPKSRMDKQF